VSILDRKSIVGPVGPNGGGGGGGGANPCYFYSDIGNSCPFSSKLLQIFLAIFTVETKLWYLLEPLWLPLSYVIITLQ